MGAAGFIGSNLVDRLLRDGKSVVGWGNSFTGQPELLRKRAEKPEVQIVKGDCLDLSALIRAMNGCDFVFPLAANAKLRLASAI